jgi:hypothetical protein
MNKHWAQSGIYRYASAKVQIKLEIKKNFARKIVLQQKKSPKYLEVSIILLAKASGKSRARIFNTNHHFV